jgi:hypothetical protein
VRGVLVLKARSLDRQRAERRQLHRRCEQVVAAYQGCRLQLKSANIGIADHLNLDLAGMVNVQPQPDQADDTTGADGSHSSVARGATAPVMEKSRSPRRGGGGGGGGGAEGTGARRGGGGFAEKVDWLSLQAMVLEFTKTTQRKLERERAGLLVRCTASEEKAARLEGYVSTHLLAYQKEIIQLRHRNELLERQTKGGPR